MLLWTSDLYQATQIKNGVEQDKKKLTEKLSIDDLNKYLKQITS